MNPIFFRNYFFNKEKKNFGLVLWISSDFSVVTEQIFLNS